MIGELQSWPLSAWIANLALLAPALIWGPRQLWRCFLKRSDRFAERERLATELVDVLRRALDKRSIRENGYHSACDLLILAHSELIALVEQAPPLVVRAQEMALEHLKAAREACREIDRMAS